MSFHVVACEQRTPPWFRSRAGVLTASDAAAMLSKPKKAGVEETAGRAELKLRLALEADGEPLDEDPYVSWDMKRGIEREAAAIDAYEAMTGEIVERVGFLRHDELPIGCSPDGLIGRGPTAYGLEVKCPKYTTHFDYLKKGTLPSEYTAQVIHSLFVTGFGRWDFVSYCPEFKGDARLFVVHVLREDVALDAYALAFHLFWKEVEQVKQTVRGLTAPELICA